MQLRRSLIELEDQNVQNGIEVRTSLQYVIDSEIGMSAVLLLQRRRIRK
jgi:hypothetical protein